uniref:Uncharacterized protein n=1 Tax=Nephroselmis olivacea TaxID=31312 RepID=Q9TKW9_NEPOL|nr:hypothetical protein NeolCp071 [Nephroselmis olivacea]AAD54847.1 unknown [Nephroselmis olivacea]
MSQHLDENLDEFPGKLSSSKCLQNSIYLTSLEKLNLNKNDPANRIRQLVETTHRSHQLHQNSWIVPQAQVLGAWLTDESSLASSDRLSADVQVQSDSFKLPTVYKREYALDSFKIPTVYKHDYTVDEFTIPNVYTREYTLFMPRVQNDHLPRNFVREYVPSSTEYDRTPKKVLRFLFQADSEVGFPQVGDQYPGESFPVSIPYSDLGAARLAHSMQRRNALVANETHELAPIVADRAMSRYRYPDMDTDQIRFLWLRQCLFGTQKVRRRVRTNFGVYRTLPRFQPTVTPLDMQKPSAPGFSKTLVQWLAFVGNEGDLSYSKLPASLVNLDVLHPEKLDQLDIDELKKLTKPKWEEQYKKPLFDILTFSGNGQQSNGQSTSKLSVFHQKFDDIDELLEDGFLSQPLAQNLRRATSDLELETTSEEQEVLAEQEFRQREIEIDEEVRQARDYKIQQFEILHQVKLGPDLYPIIDPNAENQGLDWKTQKPPLPQEDEEQLLVTSESETEPIAESKTEGMAESKTEGMAESETEGMAESETEGMAEPETEGMAEPETEGMAEPETEGMAEPETEGTPKAEKKKSPLELFHEELEEDRIVAAYNKYVRAATHVAKLGNIKSIVQIQNGVTVASKYREIQHNLRNHFAEVDWIELEPLRPRRIFEWAEGAGDDIRDY